MKVAKLLQLFSIVFGIHRAAFGPAGSYKNGHLDTFFGELIAMKYKIICLALLLFGCAPFTSAQDETPTSVTVQNRTGDLPFSQTVGTGVEHVDIGSGNLIVDVPIISLPGRHMPFNYGLRYNALFWTVATRTQVNGQQVNFWSIERRPYVGGMDQGLGFSPTVAQLSWGISTESCTNTTHTDEDTKTTASGYIYTDAGGGKHALPIVQISATSPDGGCFAGQDGTGFFQGFVADEGIFARASDIYSTPAVYLPDGTQVAWPTDNSILNPPATPDGWVPIYLAQYLDANGNNKCEDPAQVACNPSADTLGRNPLTVVNGSNQILYQFNDSDGVQRTYTVNLGTISVHTNFGIAGVSEHSQTRTVVSSIGLPNGTSYSFQYENGSYGGLTGITLPTGATIGYTWATLSPPGSPYLTHRYVSNRTVTVGTKVFSWSFSKSCVDPGCSTVNTDLGDPMGNHTLYQHSDGRVVFAKVYDGAVGAKLLRQYDVAYSALTSDPSALPIRITTTLGNGLQSKVEYDYDPTGSVPGNVSEIREFDYAQGAPGALLRRTRKVYGLNTNSAYLAANIVSKVTQESVYDSPADTCRGVAGPCAQTQYEYDNYVASGNPLQSTSSAPQHDYAGHGSSFTLRGNPTRVKRWRNTDNAWLTTTYSYDDLGNIRSIKDPLGHVTSYDYGDSFYDSHCLPPAGTNAQAYVSTVTNVLGQRIEAVRYSCTGLAQAHKDENDILANLAGTTQTFDLMNRPLITNFVDGGQVTMDYHGDALPLKSTKTTKITSALHLAVSSVTDGLGQTSQTSLDSDPEGVDYTDTNYDAFGRPTTVSNPYRSTSDPTYGITTNLYDALGRVYQTTKQDGSISKTAYNVVTSIAVNADCTIATDEAGNQRGGCSDTLGRLVEVDEPSGVPVQVNYHATLQTDGNFVLYNAASSALWSTGTSGTNAGPIYIQDDGNLVLYLFKWQAGTYATPSPGPFPAASCSIGTYLMVNQRLNPNQCIVSPHGQYFLYMAPDGNFFIYDQAHNTGTWGPGTTYGHPGAYAIMQGDGNLCVYTATNTYLWCSGTSGTNADRVNMEDDGRMIIYKSVWNSGTSDGQFIWPAMAHPGCDVGNSGLGWTGVLGTGSCLVSPNGRFELLMQGDGDLVIYDRSFTPNKALWSSGTATSPADPGFAMRTLYSYDALGNLLRVDQKGSAQNDSTQWRTRTFTYDSLSRLLTANNPESGTITYSYDLDGNLLQKTSPAPNQTGTATQTVSYCYDALHRVTGKGYGAQSCPLATPVVTYAYDSGTNAIGHLASLTDQAGTASYSYDIMGRLAGETRTLIGANNGAIPKSLSYDYNLDGSVYRLHYPSGNIVTYEPGAAGLALSVKDSGNNINYVTSGTYGPDSALTGFISGNSASFAGITNAFTYNKRLQPLTMAANAPSQTVFSIGYDFHVGNGTSGADNGNVYGITNYKDQTRNQTFTYDALNRLASARNAGTDCTATVLGGLKKFWGNNYTYDAWGNLIGKSLLQTPAPPACAGENLSVTADAHNWIHATGGSDYLYDAAGNMTFNATPPTQTYTYDQENRLTGAAGYTYTYDGDGNRVRKSSSSSTGTLYWYMTPGIVGESDLSGNLTDEYIFFDGERVARKSTNGVFYYFSDHLKTASVITDSAGVIKAESDYYPWGGELQFVANDSNHYKFTGKERDGETQLDYFGARYYSNGLGRWISADWSPTPIPVPYADFHDPQSLNLYGFVGGNPASKADPDGHETLFSSDKAEEAFNQRMDKVDAFVIRALNHPAVQAYVEVLGFKLGGSAEEGAAAGTARGVEGTAAKGAGETGVTANAEKGAAFEKTVVDATKATDSKVAEQVTLKTESGVKTKMDVVSTKTSKEVRLQEAKSTATARLTKNQKMAHPEIEKSGATVVGKGKPDYPGGTKIPPTKVEIVRPKE